MEKSYNYSDIYLGPRYSELPSRSLADVSVDFLGRRCLLPIIPSNMTSVIDKKIAKWCSENDYFYIMHRFGDTRAFIERANQEKWKLISISVGVNDIDKQLIEYYYRDQEKATWGEDYRIDYITIDVAHGHHLLVKTMIAHIKKWLPNTKIIAGNVCTVGAVEDLAYWGADAVKIGLSMGKACTTYHNTGVGSPMFSTLEKLVPIAKQNNVQLIGDGGIREFGDVCKALSIGVDLLMIGSMISACIDSPAVNITKFRKTGFCNEFGQDEIESVIMKSYFGSASQYQKNSGTFIEGREIMLECNGLTVKQFYQKAKEAIQSSISYAGGKNTKDLRNFDYSVL